jgi:hypothetical protein
MWPISRIGAATIRVPDLTSLRCRDDLDAGPPTIRNYGLAGAGVALNVPVALKGWTSIVPFISFGEASVAT